MQSSGQVREEFNPEPGTLALAVGVIAATYGYFLIFAQFGFLGAVEAAGGTPESLLPVMTVMGAAGIGGSVIAAGRFHARRAHEQLAQALGICAAAAGLTIIAHRLWVLAGIAALVGFGTGAATVTLATMLRRVLGGERLGRWVGLGTGLAYAFSNLPPVFEARPAGQAVFGLLLALAGIPAAMALKLRGPDERSTGFDHARAGAGAWVLVLVALVWLDSAAFYIIQHTPDLKGDSWSGHTQLYLNATVHLVAAVLAGWALDQRKLGLTTAVAAALLLSACLLLDEAHRTFALGVILFAAGVSGYSTMLLFYPAWSARPWRAALVFSVAGWTGSALGIGMARNLGRVPGWFVALAGTVVTVALLARWVGLRRSKGAVAAGALMLLLGWPQHEARAVTEENISRGRQVFISEGCIHCHSQYVRPGTVDEVRWGPAQPLSVAQAQRPPLFGNRRQGPDLQTAAARRSREWNRAHLIAPRTITPGSRMPSYAHLFAGGGARGEALLSYLDSLGGETIVEHQEAANVWHPDASAQLTNPTAQRRLFAQWCAGCHGESGHGDGPAAANLSIKPRDLTRDAWRFIPSGTDAVEENISLARLIKFGVPGTAMAGREYLGDEAVLSLAAYLQTLRKISTTTH